MKDKRQQLLEESAFLREKQLVGDIQKNCIGLLPFSRATLWRHVKAGTFPQPVKLSEKTTAWPTIEIKKWMADPAAYKAGKVRY
ncbi:helix-turn-helix transcriptional regulator [Acidihalobacter prosperus]|uniref:helix-turn-helix transcriptional regulator n=1 Tax=Acidihalobacter prosperus TaxID=160660 RepID=UPI0009EEE050|nr:AlpA family phage regulatory protein [Acidihalobacter prosperus]